VRIIHQPLLFLAFAAGCNGCEGIIGQKPDDTGLTCVADLVITEIMYDPDALSDGDGEYFELYNVGDTTCSLEGLVITREDSDHTIAEKVIVPPGGYVVLAKSEVLGEVIDVAYVYGGSIALTDETTLCIGDDIGFLDCVAYGGSDWPDPDSGVSLALNPEHLDADENDDPDWWCGSETDLGNGDLGSPGEDGPACEPPPPPPEDPDLVISEAMPDPNACGNDPVCEYIEVYNADDEAMPMSSVVIYDDGVAIGDGRLNEDCTASIAPGGYGLFANDAESVADLAGLAYDEVCQMSLSLKNDGEPIGVGYIDDDGVEHILDEVDYSTLGHPWDAGVSMNLSDDALTALANDDGANWCESTIEFGTEDIQYGTPGSANETCPLPVWLEEGDAFFTELMAKPVNPPGATDGEYIEAYNDSGEDIPLADLELLDQTTAKSLDCTETIWYADTVLVIARNTDTAVNGGFEAYCQAGFGATDGGDSFSLLYTQPDNSELILDVLTYDSAWPIAQGYAMELQPGACFSAEANDDPGCWALATEEFGDAGQYGTPGSVP
jgi:hypothetical protein